MSALCGALLVGEQIETVAPGEGMPCTMCLLLRSRSAPQPPPAPAVAPATGGPWMARAPLVAAVGYRAWGWPVSVRGDRVVLELDRQMVARVIPNVLSEQVRAVLTAHRWPAPVLAYPSLRGSWVVLAGEPFGAPLP